MQIIFKNFIVETTIGVYEYEKQQKREIPISLLIPYVFMFRLFIKILQYFLQAS